MNFSGRNLQSLFDIPPHPISVLGCAGSRFHLQVFGFCRHWCSFIPTMKASPVGLQRKGNTAQLFKAEKQAGQQWVGLSLLTETSKVFTRRCGTWMSRHRFWLWLWAENSPNPICCEAEGQNELAQEISREGPVTKLGRWQNPFFW